MKVKNIELLNSVEALAKINASELGIKTSFKIAKAIKKVEENLSLYNSEKKKLFSKYGEKKEDGELNIDENGQLRILDSISFNRDLEELNNIEVELEVEKLDIEELNGVVLTPGEVITIDYLIK